MRPFSPECAQTLGTTGFSKLQISRFSESTSKTTSDFQRAVEMAETVGTTMPVCWNWQTRWTQNPLVATPCGFDPRHRHHPETLREQGFGIFFDLPGDDIWCGCFCYMSDIFPCRRIFRVCNPLSQRFSRFFGGRWRTIYALAGAGDSSEAGKKPRIAWADATLEL